MQRLDDLAGDMAYGQRVMIATTPDADMKEGTDYLIGSFRIAWRRRRISVKKYGEVSIRYQRANGSKTEYAKILSGEARPHLFIFEFSDAYVIMSGPTMVTALKDNVGYVNTWNKDGKTKAYYIPLAKVPHVILAIPS